MIRALLAELKISRDSKVFTKKQSAEPVEVLGQPFRCSVCSHGLFYQGKAQLNTAVASLLRLDWANRTVTYIACEQCGHIDWFNQ